MFFGQSISALRACITLLLCLSFCLVSTGMSVYAEAVPIPFSKPETSKKSDTKPLFSLKKKPVSKSVAVRPQPLDKKGVSSSSAVISAHSIAKLYYGGQVSKAYKAAARRVQHTGEKDAKAAWIAGLSAWRLGEYKNAAAYFERAAMVPNTSIHLVSAAAYWAGRANMRAGNIQTVSHWYNLARKQPETFYGLLATRALGVQYTVPKNAIGRSKYINERSLSIQPELIKSLIKQESKFDPNATNPSGATGLMQILPSTASYIMGSDVSSERLKNPAYNLKVGQKYIKTMLKHPNVKGNFLYLLIAYNAGPGNLGKYKRKLSDVDDGLLFIESIPSSETRAYIERVLTYYWLGMIKKQKYAESLDALAAGETPMYPHYKVASKN